MRMIKPGNAPRSLAGGLGGCTSPHGANNSLSSEEKNYSLPLRVTREDIDALPPLEKIFAEHLIETRPGEVFIVVERSEG